MRSRGNLPWDSKLTSKGAPDGACRVVDLQQEEVYTSGAERRETCSRRCKRSDCSDFGEVALGPPK